MQEMFYPAKKICKTVLAKIHKLNCGNFFVFIPEKLETQWRQIENGLYRMSRPDPTSLKNRNRVEFSCDLIESFFIVLFFILSSCKTKKISLLYIVREKNSFCRNLPIEPCKYTMVFILDGSSEPVSRMWRKLSLFR